MNSIPESVDVVIVGGGLVGSSLALALRGLPLSLALIEPRAPGQTAVPAWDERCIAINAASQRIFRNLGVWDAMAADAAPILSTHIGEAGRFGVARFSAQQAGLPALGYNTPLRTLNAVLEAEALRSPELLVLAPARLDSVRFEAAGATLTVEREGVLFPLRARLVVAADGADSPLRAQLGVEARARDYGQSAIVSAIRPQRSTSGVAYERFLPTGPLAVLPKPDDARGHAASLVWTLPTAQAAAALQWSDAEFLLRAQAAFGGRLGRFETVGQRLAYPLRRVLSEQLTAPRCVFLGNAAQSLHPVAAQGFNLGLRDVATLADVLGLAVGSDPAAPELLAEYARRRSTDRARAAGFTDALARLFSNRVPGLSQLRHLGLLALDLTPPLHRRVLRENLGLSGHVPRLARA